MKNLYKLSAIAFLALSLRGQDVYRRVIDDMRRLTDHDSSTMTKLLSVYAGCGSLLLTTCSDADSRFARLCTRLEKLDDYTRRRIPAGTDMSMTLAQYLASALTNRLHFKSDRPVHYTTLEMPLLVHYGLLNRHNNTFLPEIRAIAQKNVAILTNSGYLVSSGRQ